MVRPMDKPSKKLLRCAVYTRKSTDHNLDLEFNSLDAQRESCEAYIKSQAHEGWRLIPDHYDDGAFSGGSLKRPALQQLLADVEASLIDVIVVYKVDRLTRSLADFAKLVELFDQRSVSFVSVTQSFNTTSSMGRLTLNVLLSFAQFEREVSGERVRDKIAASKAKGIWVGGSIPLGYASVNKKLVLVPDEAETVRLIFRRYLELGSIGRLIKDLDRKGVRTKRQTLSSGKIRGNIRFGTGALTHLLRNRFYIGEVVFKGSTYTGEHPPLLDRKLFDAVQAALAAKSTARQLKLRGSTSILAGRIYDDRGNRMTPTHTNKRGARYRYYISHALLQKRDNEAGSVSRISAPELEVAVIKAARDRDAAQSEGWSSTGDDQEIINRTVERVIVEPKCITVRFYADVTMDARNSDGEPTRICGDMISIPYDRSLPVAAKGIVYSPPSGVSVSTDERDALITAIAKARLWVDDLVSGRAASFAEIAAREGKAERHIRHMAPLAFISPRLLTLIVNGLTPSIPAASLAKMALLSWKAQQEASLPRCGIRSGRLS